jgi:universal stress protein A
MPLSQNILVATDFSEGARAGLDMAAQIARETGAKVTVCHVLDPSPLAPVIARPSQAEGEQATERAIHEALTKVIRDHFAGVTQAKTALIISQSASEGICHYAEKENVDLIVVSTHGRTGLAHLLIGSVAEKIVRHAPCPVLSVRVAQNVE